MEHTRGLLIFVVLYCLLGFAIPSTSVAVELSAISKPLWNTCAAGSAGGQCRIPRGVVADPANGHIFLSDQTNQRIEEFDAFGHFIRAWGWDVVASGPDNSGGGGFEICVQAKGDTCQAGSSGGGAGQFGAFGPQGIAVDSGGNVYVVDFSNRRVEKFNGKGEFLLAFGSSGSAPGQFGAWKIGSFIAIDKNGTMSAADDKVYVSDPERIERFNVSGEYQGEFPLPVPERFAISLAVGPDGYLYAVYSTLGGGVFSGIHKLTPTGIEVNTHGEPVAPNTPLAFEMNDPNGKSVAATAIAIDSNGNLFAFGPTSYGGGLMNPIFVFGPEGGKPIAQFGIGEFSIASTGLSTSLCAESEAPGNLYVTQPSSTSALLRAYGTEPIGCFKARTLPASEVEETSATLNGTVNPSGLAVSECFFEFGIDKTYGETFECEPSAGSLGEGSEPVPVAFPFEEGDLQAGTVYHYRLVAKVGEELETGSDEEFKTKGPPVISRDFTASVNESEATLRALVNPEGLGTSCHFEYGVGEALNQSTTTEAVGSDRTAHLFVGNLKGLSPGTLYDWRLSCQNESGPSQSALHAFITYLPSGAQSCPNEAFRTGVAASLPDCRAYEMVSPVDKNGGDIVSELSNPDRPGGYVQARPDGNLIAYTSTAAFGDIWSTMRFNQYLAERVERGQPEEGWVNEGIHPPIEGHSVDPVFTFGFFREFMAFSPDLCDGWLIDYQTPPVAEEGQEGYANFLREGNCEPELGEVEALTNAEPPSGTEKVYIDEDSFQGISADSSHALFAARAKLTPEAAAGTAKQLYDSYEEELHLVSVLPGGEAASSGGEVGSGRINGVPGNQASAISTDGSRVYWSSGQIYLREHPEQGIVAGECEGGAACTIPVSKETATFWAASPDGSKAIYVEGSAQGPKLFEFSLARYEAKEPPRRLIGEGVEGVAGTSADLSRVYFVSTKKLVGSGENSEGAEAAEGQPNLYLAEGEAVRFVGTLSGEDLKAESGSEVAYKLTEAPYYRATRTTPDGSHLVFESRARLTGYDNSDAADGRPDVEVYAFDANGRGGEGKLTCVSCNPGGAAPRSREMRQPYSASFESLAHHTNVPAAAWIPTWEGPLHASNVLSASGDRIFFNAADRLLPRDANGTVQDVYEWEAPGTGSCEAGGPNYFASNGGCLYLVSSGESSYESEFWEASEDGRDVFFTTESSLLPKDPGSVDLYDARVDGGFPEPEAKAECEGEACQSPPPAPEYQTPASSTYKGPANPKSPKQRRCPKGKRKVKKRGKVRCLKRRHHKRRRHRHHARHQRRAHANRRAPR